MDNATSYVQFYTNSHIGNELLYPVSCSFVNACLFPISFNFTSETSLLGRLTFFGFEQRNASLTGNIILFKKAEKEILSILNSQLNRIDSHIATLNKEMFDYTVPENQLVLQTTFGEYTKHKQVQIIKGTAPTQQNKVITIGQLYNATIKRIQNILIHERNIQLDAKYSISYLKRILEMSSRHESIISSYKSYKSTTVLYQTMLKDLSSFERIITPTFTQLGKLQRFDCQQYIYNSKMYSFSLEHKMYLLNINTLKSEHEMRLGAILKQNKPVRETIGQLFNNMKKVKANQFNMSLLSTDIFSNDNIKIFYSSLIKEYTTHKESTISPILKFNAETHANMILFPNGLGTIEHSEKYLGDEDSFGQYLKDLRNYQETQFEIQMSKTAKMATLSHIEETEGSPKKHITLNYILTIESLAKSFNILVENYHIEKNPKDLFYENFHVLFNRIREHGGTISGITSVDVIRKNEATIIDNFNIIDKQLKDSALRYTFSDFINKKEKDIKTSINNDFDKEKLLTKNSNIHTILDKLDKDSTIHNSINIDKEQKLLDVNNSLVHFVTKEQKKTYKFVSSSISKINKEIEKSNDFIHVTRPQVKEVTSSINLTFEKGTIRNINVSKTKKYSLIRNLDFSILNKRISIDKDQKEISDRNKLNSIEKNQKEISNRTELNSIEKDQKEISNRTELNLIEKDQKEISDNKLHTIEKDQKEIDDLKELVSVERPIQYEAWILSPGELASVLPREVDILKNILGASTNERLGKIDSRLVLVEKYKETTTLFDIYFALQKEDKTILINLNQTIEHAEHIVTALNEYKQIEKQLKEVYESVMNKFDSIEKEISLSTENQIEKPLKNIEIFSLPILEHLKYFDLKYLINLQKSQKHVIINSEGHKSVTRQNEIILIDKFIYTEMYRRWYFLPEDGENDGPYDWMILPMDFPYAQHPEYNIKEHPIIDGGSHALNEIPVSVKKVEDVIEFCFQLWESHLELYSRYTPEQAVKHFVNLIYEWLTKYLPEMIYKMPKSYPDDYGWKYNDQSYKEEYWRIYRWIRWYAEAIIINVSEQDKKSLVGNIYVSKLVNDMVKYFNDHHGKYGMPNVPESSIINKVKGKRHKWLSNNFNKLS